MLDCISVENMRLSDERTIAAGTDSRVLMGRAAEGVFRAAVWQGPAAIAAGAGNNGGDGYALACLLRRAGIDCAVFAVGSRRSADSDFYARQAQALGVPVSTYRPGCLDGFSTVVDCLLGTGFRGALRENYRQAIAGINASGAFVVSVDINSGMDGDTGQAELAVRSDLTVTIGYVKRGLITRSAGMYMKRLVCVDIGIGLARQEDKICAEEQWQALGLGPGEQACRDGIVYHRCPAWLDMDTRKIL